MKIRYWFLVVGVGTLAILTAIAPLWMGPIYYIPSGAMEPTLHINDRIMVSKSAYRGNNPARGDIALLNLPVALIQGSGTGSITFIKRVVAVPGDRIEMVKGVLKINGVVQSEPFVKWTGGPLYDLKVIAGKVYMREAGNPDWSYGSSFNFAQNNAAISRTPTQPLPPQKYLILGDNRGNSNDSHVFGLVGRSAFFARASRRIWPSFRSF